MENVEYAAYRNYLTYLVFRLDAGLKCDPIGQQKSYATSWYPDKDLSAI